MKLKVIVFLLMAVSPLFAQSSNGSKSVTSGTVTSVSGTANQIDVATGTTTPVISLDAAINLPGTINKLTLTPPATGSTLTLADGKTLTVSNTLTLAATDGSTITLGAGGTVLYTSSLPLSIANGGTGAATQIAGCVFSNNAASTAAPACNQTLTLGLNGGTGGSLTLNGSTSGSALIGVTAAAGTLTLPVGTGTNPTLQATGGATNTGVTLTTTNGCWSNVGVFSTCFGSATGVGIGGNKSLSFGSANGANTSQALGMSESVLNGNALSLDTTAVGNELALLRTGQPCRITADITLPVNTATTVCSWSLPAVAKAWSWKCDIPWAITAGSGTNTLAIVANPSQTPTAATAGTAEIKTTNTNTATELTTAISTSGGTTLLTSPTITPAATTFLSSTSGTLLASATAGTFAIQMTAAGTTATAAAKNGARCELQ